MCKIITKDPRTSDIPVIFISGMTSAEQRIRGLLAGAVDYINKPFDFNEVKLRLAIHLKNRAVSTNNIVNHADNLQDEPLQTNSLHTILFHSARIHLLRCLATTPKMKELEKLTKTNSKQLNAAFKKCTGVTVYEYLREERMQEAKLLLQKTQLAIQGIAYQIGFKESANFTTAFKDRFGLTPRDFRQKNF